MFGSLTFDILDGTVGMSTNRYVTLPRRFACHENGTSCVRARHEVL